MKRSETDGAGISSLRLVIALGACVLIPLLAIASMPTWWSERGVLNSNVSPDDYALVNQGQLKNIAKAAVAEFDAHLPGGAGDVLHNLVTTWGTPTSATNDFAPVNLGQLKNVAKPFYDRLISVGYVINYPWTGASNSPDDYAIANIGQAKNLFSFDLRATDIIHDSDQNGLADWWEVFYFGHIGVDPNAPAPRGDGLTILQAFQQGLDPIHVGQPGQTLTATPGRVDEVVNAGQTVTRTVTLRNNSGATRQFRATLETSDHSNISFSDSDQTGGPQFVWNDISASGTHLDAISDEDEAIESIDLSFAFPYFGDSYRKIYVSSNGFVTVGSSGQTYNNYSLPNQAMPANEIAAFHADLDLGASGDVYYRDYGDRLVVQFNNAARYDGNGVDTFQIVLKNDGTILFYYKDMTGDVTSATVGLQDSTKQNGLTVAYQEPYLKNNLAVRIAVVTERFSSLIDHIAWSDSDQPDGPQFAWNDISATGTHLNNVSNADDGFEAFNISFPFPYFSSTYSTVYVSSNGYVTLGSGSNSYQTGQLPSQAMPANDIAAFQDDLNLGASGDVYYQETSDGVTIQFTNAARYAGNGLGTFQIVLKRDGTIFFYYKQMTGTLNRATVGVQNANRDKGLTIANQQTYLKSNLAVRINTNIPWLQASPLTGSLAPGETTDLTVTLSALFLSTGTFHGRINIVTDNPGDLAVAVPVTMTIYELPSVTLLAPLANTVALTSSPLVLQASPVAVSGVARVEFYDGSTLLGSATTAPYIFTWPQPAAGSHLFSAKVIDSHAGAANSSVAPVQILLDSDGNGLSDAWEMQYFGHLGEDANGDFDHDGVSNADEFRRGSDPTLTDTDGDGVPNDEDAFPEDANRTMLPPSHALVDLKTGNPVAVSDAGFVVGNDNATANQAFLWKQGVLTLLGAPDTFLYPEPSDVNDQGVVVGHLTDPNVWYYEHLLRRDTGVGFIWTPPQTEPAAAAAWTVLIPPGHSQDNPNDCGAVAINNSGTVVGSIYTVTFWGDAARDGYDTATKWIDGIASDLGWGNGTDAFAINSSGAIAGSRGVNVVVDNVDIGAGSIKDFNDNGDILWANRLTLADGTLFPELDSSSGAAGQLNNAREVVFYWNGAAFWKKHPKARKYDSFQVAQLADAAAFEELGLSSENGLYLTAINNNSVLAGFGYDDDGYSKGFLLVPAALVPDYNRDGKIDDKDRDQVTADNPYHFWINDDDDSGDTGGNDIPGAATPNYSTHPDPTPPPGQAPPDRGYVDGVRDLVDFFPLFLDIKELLRLLPADGPTPFVYKLKQQTEALNFVYTDLTPQTSRDYLVKLTGEGLDNTTALGQAETRRITAAGVPLNATWLNGIRDNGKGIILLEGRSESTDPLILEVYDSQDHKVAAIRLSVSLSGVENMFRHKNFRIGWQHPLSKFDAGVVDRLGQPPNYPDQLCNNKWMVMVHGYNVSGTEARGWNAEMFKRFYWSGSKAKFYGVSWYGDPYNNDQQYPPNYHLAVKNAFYTAPRFAEFVNGIADGNNVTVMSHSLGNLVVGAAIQDQQTHVENHFMIDASVALEAYDSAAPRDDDAMVHPDWNAYPERFRASEWYSLFDSQDARSSLTWRDRLGLLVANVYNFYSSSEDVLARQTGAPTKAFFQIGILTGKNSWALQEKLKGRRVDINLWALNAMVGSLYGGWSFNLSDPTDHNDPIYYDIDSTTQERVIKSPASLAGISNEQLKRLPVFDPGYELDAKWGPDWIPGLYNPVTGSQTAGDADHRITLLAEMFPARTLAAGGPGGGTANAIFGADNNFDMPALFKTDNNSWPIDRGEWHHGNVKDVAYSYLFKLFDTFAELGSLK